MQAFLNQVLDLHLGIKFHESMQPCFQSAHRGNGLQRRKSPHKGRPFFGVQTANMERKIPFFQKVLESQLSRRVGMIIHPALETLEAFSQQEREHIPDP